MDLEDIFINIENFTFAEDEIDNGNYGHVFSVKEKKTGKKYAAKELEASSYLSPKSQQTLMREVIILKKIHHPAIIEFKGFSFISFQDLSQWQPTIFTGFVENKTLYTILENANRGLSPKEWTNTKQYINLLGIASAMKYLHYHKILHRDLKPANILLDKDFYPKICDFGFSRQFNEPNMNSKVGTQIYIAPEILEGNTYGPPVDVYSFAIMACEIVSSNKALPDIDIMDMKIMKKIVNGTMRPKFSQNVNSNLKELIEKCWDSNPNNRPTFEEIYSELSQKVDNYIEKVDKSDIEKYINLLDEEQKKLNPLTEHLKNQNNHKNFVEEKQKFEEQKKNYEHEIENLKNQNSDLLKEIDSLKNKLSEKNDSDEV